MGAFTYVDLDLVHRFPNSRSAIKYNWSILDFNQRGFISAEEIYYFYRSIRKELKQMEIFWDAEPEAFITEMFDLVQPIEPGIIRIHDLIDNATTSTFFRNLFDINQHIEDADEVENK
jgi:hypothetical protein